MNDDAWTVIGAGTSLPQVGLGPSGHVLQLAALKGLTLFDCGPGTLRSLPSCGLQWTDVRRVVLTHFHIDHCVDLAALAFARRNPVAQAGPLEIYAPAGIERVLAGLEQAFGRNAVFRDTELTILYPDAGAIGIDLGGARLRWIPNGHTADSVSVAVETESGPVVVYTGDTGPSVEVEALAGGADLLVCECSFPDPSGVKGHLTPRLAAELATRAGVARLLLTHFYPMLSPADAARDAALHFDGPIEIAQDGSRHPLLTSPRRN